jgi:hypothetical protein
MSLAACATLLAKAGEGERRMRRRGRSAEDYHVTGVADRLGAYEAAHVPSPDDDTADPELVERAATLLSVMPRNQLRATIEQLVSPNDLERARRAIDSLIDSAFAIEDETGHIRRSG